MKCFVTMLAGALVVPALLIPRSGWAQISRAPGVGAPSPAHAADCARAVRVLSTGGSRADVASSRAQIAACGSEAGPAVASYFRRLRAGRDTSAFRHVLDPAGTVRDGHLFAAALDVAADHGATPEARAAGVLAAALATRPNLGFDLAALMRQGEVGPCPVQVYDHTVTAAGAAPLPGDASTRVAATVLQLADASEPLLVRRAANCARLIASTSR